MTFPFVLEMFIAWRYLRSPGKVPIFNTGTRLAFLFLALMVFVMIIVLSVFIGFQNAVQETLLHSGYHLSVSRHLTRPFHTYKTILNRSKKEAALQELLQSSFPSISVNSLLASNGQFEAKNLRAVPLTKSPRLLERFRHFPDIIHYRDAYLRKLHKGNYVLIGREMARYYGLQIGSKIELLLPKGAYLRTAFDIQRASFRVAAFYHTGFYEFDSHLIFMSLASAQRVLGIPKQATEVIFQLKKLSDLDKAQSLLRQTLPRPRYHYAIQSIKDERGNFLAALQLEKTLMILILSLLVLAGVAGVCVTVRLSVKARSQSIGMLRAMGMPTFSILFIFTMHSIFIGFLATALGSSLGIYAAERLENIINLIESLINLLCYSLLGECSPISLIPQNIYYFDHLPVKADLGLIFSISFATLVLSGLAGYLPARAAVNVDPVESIRSE